MTLDEYIQHLHIVTETPANLSGLKQRLALRAKQLDEPLLADISDDQLLDYNRNLQTKCLNEWIVSPLLAALPSDVVSTLNHIPVIVLPIRVVNAHTFRAPSGEPLVVVDQGFFNMAEYYFDMLLGSINLKRGEDAVAEKAYINRSIRFIIEYVQDSGTPDFPLELVEISKLQRALVLASTWGVIAFCVAHELAHIWLGHLKQTARTFINPPEQGSYVDVYQMLQEEELQADQQGCQWYLSFMESVPIIQTVPADIAAIFPLWMFPLLALIEANLGTPDRYSTHPAALRRVISLVQRLYLLKTDPTKEFALQAIEQTYINQKHGKRWYEAAV